MTFELPALPYAYDALGPYMSAETLEFHHDKHHNAYVTKLNEMVAGTDNEGKSLEEIIKSAEGGLFNQAAQVWNHTFFWHCLTPNAGAPGKKLTDALVKAFGGVDDFKKQFTEVAAGTFGSGWAWLVQGDDGKLKTAKTPNGSNPLATGEGKVLLGLDVWEHSYYLDFRNRRPDYVMNFLDKLANYELAEANLG